MILKEFAIKEGFAKSYSAIEVQIKLKIYK